MAESLDHEASNSDMLKWGEMVDLGISQYMRQHPDRFHRRVRRGIPSKFRWQVWKAAVCVQDSELPTDFHDLSLRENPWTQSIEVDIPRTFPDVKAFDAAQQQRLLRILNAYASYNPKVGYCQGMNFVAGLLLLVSDHEEESFGVLICLMDRMGLSGFYTEKLPLLRRYLRACDRLVAETVPELREHFIKESVQPAMYLHQWFLTLFINCFPLSMVMIIWDVIICEGFPVILRIAVSILQVLKDSLLSMHFEDIIRFFKMMKTYEAQDGDLNASRIGQLLMKHTEHVVIPERVLEYLNREPLDDDANLDSDESWEADLNGGGWMQTITRMLSFGSTRRRGSASTDSRLPSGGYGGGSVSTPRRAAAPEARGGDVAEAHVTTKETRHAAAATVAASSPSIPTMVTVDGVGAPTRLEPLSPVSQNSLARREGVLVPATASTAATSKRSWTTVSSAEEPAAIPEVDDHESAVDDRLRGDCRARDRAERDSAEGDSLPVVPAPTSVSSATSLDRETPGEEDRSWEFL